MNCNKRDTIYMYYKHMGTLFWTLSKYTHF